MAGNDSNADQFKDNVTYDGPSMPSEWLINGDDMSNTSSRIISLGNSVVDYSCPPIWGDQSVLGYCNMNVESKASSSSSLSGVRAGVNWMPNAMLGDGMFMPAISSMLPDSLPPLPSDSTDPAFIKRAARFSCFSGGTFSEILSPFSFPNPLNPCSQEVFTGEGLKPSPGIEPRSVTEGEFKNEKQTGVDVSANQCDEAEFGGLDAQQNLVGASAESSVQGLGLKKRKRTKQKPDNHEDNEASQPDAEKANDTADIRQKGNQCLSSRSNLGGKLGKEETEGSDPPEEGYIHVRARRGRATNSHSLAERVRREKISERMKHLQDLVPGCNKVTGKAVMLDEIINYVQSLQRQVEFLSMKLATVNPQLQFNMEGFLAKDILQSGAGLAFHNVVHNGLSSCAPLTTTQDISGD